MMITIYPVVLASALSTAALVIILVFQMYVSKYTVSNLEKMYRVFSLMWPASMQIYENKRNSLHKK